MGTIDPNSQLLDEAEATLLEGWLGQGDLDWTSHWYGGVGAPATGWHAAADTLTHTVSIYKATNALGQEVLVGGYAVSDWSGNGVYKSDSTAFIFNLTQPEFQASINASKSILPISPLLEEGMIYMGVILLFEIPEILVLMVTLEVKHTICPKVLLDVGNGNNIDYNNNPSFRITALETFTFVTAAPEPEPSTGSGLTLTSDFVPSGTGDNEIRFAY